VTGHPIPVEIGPRRAGDPAVLVASSAAATDALGWRAEKTDLNTIVGDAWSFMRLREPV
jgi:UDP-glucose 4-epimerase